MFMETPNTLILVAGGAFLLGWLVSAIVSAIAGGVRARKRDPRDDRIRNLEAEVRVAQTKVDKANEELEERTAELDAEKECTERRDTVITEQQQMIAQLKADLKDSVRKTRELRHELSDRAAENVKSEVKLREVETELSVAQASTDLIATGVLDYSIAPDAEEEGDDEGADQAKAAP